MSGPWSGKRPFTCDPVARIMALGWRDDYKKWALELIDKIESINGVHSKTLFGKVRDDNI